MDECLISLGVSCIFHKQQLMTSFKEQAQTPKQRFGFMCGVFDCSAYLGADIEL